MDGHITQVHTEHQEHKEDSMTKRMIGLVLALLLVTTISMAQVPRNNDYSDPGKTSLTNLGLTGLDVTSNPSYIELRGHDTVRAIYWYLWIDCTGDLVMASRTTLEAFSSFPSGDWAPPACGGGYSIGTVIGSQS